MRTLLGALALALLVPAAPRSRADLSAPGPRSGRPASRRAPRTRHPAAAAAPATARAAQSNTRATATEPPSAPGPCRGSPCAGWSPGSTTRGTSSRSGSAGCCSRSGTWPPSRCGRAARRAGWRFPSEEVWVSGETGLMGLDVDPGFARNGRFYMCQGGFRSGGRHDVRVIAWRLNAAATEATRIRTLVSGFPTSTGRHGGCRVMVARNGSLIVGTGDARRAPTRATSDSLGGKTLRLNRRTGAPWPGTRSSTRRNTNRRYVLTYGHRNVQGLAQRSGRFAVVGRAGQLPRRRGEPARPGWQLRLEPGPGLQRERPDDRPVTARSPDRRAVALRRTHARDERRVVRARDAVARPQRDARGRRAEGESGRLPEVRQQRRPGQRSRPDGVAPVRKAPLGHAGCRTATS